MNKKKPYKRTIVAFEAAPELTKKLDAFCKDTERTRSFIIRKAVEEYINKRYIVDKT